MYMFMLILVSPDTTIRNPDKVKIKRAFCVFLFYNLVALPKHCIGQELDFLQEIHICTNYEK